MTFLLKVFAPEKPVTENEMTGRAATNTIGKIAAVLTILLDLYLLLFLPLGINLAVFLFIGLPLTLSVIRIIPEYQRGVLFNLGRYDGIVGPGIVFVAPILQNLQIVDLRIHTIDIPPQEVITKDNVSVQVNGVVFFRVIDPAKAVLKVRNYMAATSALAQTTLRDVIGGVTLDELLESRDEVAAEIRKIVDEKTDAWGIDITEIRLQDVTLPESMKRAMAVQAEAEREKRAVIIKAEGELTAARKYAEAAKTLTSVPGGLTLRTLQTISDISKDPSQKIYFILPIELLEAWAGVKNDRPGD